MNARNKVAALVKDEPGEAICDACIMHGTGITNRSVVNEVTRKLSRIGMVSGFSRQDGKCRSCQHTRLVIRYGNLG